jgi:hypothetical protein
MILKRMKQKIISRCPNSSHFDLIRRLKDQRMLDMRLKEKNRSFRNIILGRIRKTSLTLWLNLKKRKRVIKSL